MPDCPTTQDTLRKSITPQMLRRHRICGDMRRMRWRINERMNIRLYLWKDEDEVEKSEWQNL